MARAPQIDELSRVLGGIEAQLVAINRTQVEDRSANASWRTTVRHELAAIRSDIGDMNGSVKAVTAEVEEIKPVVADYIDRRAGALAIGRAGQVIAGLFGAGFLFALQKLWAKFGG